MRYNFGSEFAALVAVAVLGASPATAQTDRWTPPRAADGHVDLQGIWANNTATPLERPDSLADKETFTDEELARLRESAQRLFGGADDAAFGDGVFNAVLADSDEYKSGDGVTEENPEGTGNYSSVWMVNREFENRTSLITDPPNGKLPALTPTAEVRIEVAAEYRRAHPADGPEDLTRQVRCITYGIPRVGGLGAGYNSYYQIFQTPDYFVMLGEMIHDARVIPISDMPHIGDSVRQWHGDSRGHWEGDTLVVETANFNGKNPIRGSTENMLVTERFTRVDDETIIYRFTIDDEIMWTRPWSAELPMKKTIGPLFEHACHEGNYGLPALLIGARTVEQAFADGRGPEPFSLDTATDFGGGVQ